MQSDQPMTMKVTAGSLRPSAGKAAAPPKKADVVAKPKAVAAEAAKATATGRSKTAARAQVGQRSSALDLSGRFDDTLQRVKQRNKELTADLEALLAGMK